MEDLGLLIAHHVDGKALGGLAAVVIGVVVQGVALSVEGIDAWRRRCGVLDAPVSTCSSVLAARSRVAGRARPRVVLTAPVTAMPCVWFRWEVQRREGAGVRPVWLTMSQGSSWAPFALVDGTGEALVRLEGAEVHAPLTYRQQAGASGLAMTQHHLRAACHQGLGPDEIARFESQRGPVSDWAARPLAALGNDYRVAEWRIDPGHDVQVVGDANRHPSAGGFVFGAQRGKELVVLAGQVPIGQVRPLRRTVAGLLAGAVAALVATSGVHVHVIYLTDPPAHDGGSVFWRTGDAALLVAAVYVVLTVVVLYGLRLHDRLAVRRGIAAPSRPPPPAHPVL